MTRTSRVGYLRDIRRLTVALSRARLGLYILGRRDVFEACYELRPAFELLLQRPDKLTLITGEMWPSQRPQADEEIVPPTGDASTSSEPAPPEAVMEGVEHLGQYVFEMTSAKVKQLRSERGLQDVPEEEIMHRVDEQEEVGYSALQPANEANGEEEAPGEGVEEQEGKETAD